MTTATATITYRKTKTGEWVAYGPAAAVKANAYITVAKRSGQTKTELVERVGRPFDVDGVQMVYGYLADGVSAAPARSYYSTRSTARSCEACQDVEDMGDANGCSRHRGAPRN